MFLIQPLIQKKRRKSHKGRVCFSLPSSVLIITCQGRGRADPWSVAWSVRVPLVGGSPWPLRDRIGLIWLGEERVQGGPQ